MTDLYKIAELYKLLLSISLSGAVLAAVLLLLRPLYNGKIKRTCQYYIWILVLLRFLVPLTFEASLINQIIPHSTANNTIILANETAQTAQTASADKPSGGTMVSAESGSLPSLLSYSILLLWFAVFALLLIYKTISYRVYLHFVKENSDYITDPNLLDLLFTAQEELNIKGRIELMHQPNAASPMLIGLFRPIIILPDISLNNQDMYNIFRHELIHHKRRDLLYKWFVQVIVCLHWFNPLVYFMAKEVNKNCELSCDEILLKKMTDTEKFAYGDMLLRSVKSSASHNPAAILTLSENGKQLKERLHAITHDPKKKHSMVLSFVFAASVLIISLGLGTYTYAKEAAASSSAAAGTNDSDSYTFHDYMMSSFYAGGYIFDLGAAALPDDLSKYCDTSRDITLSDGSVKTLFFFDDFKKYADDKTMLKHITKAVDTFAKEIIGYNSPLTNYFSVNHVYGPYTGTPKQLAKQFYKENQIAGFTAVFDQLNDKQKKTYADTFYQDYNYAYFSIAAEGLDEHTIKEFADRAYQDEEYGLFSICADNMDSSAVMQYAEQFYQDDNSGFFALITSLMNTTQLQEWLTRAEKDHKTAFLYMLKEPNAPATSATQASESSSK